MSKVTQLGNGGWIWTMSVWLQRSQATFLGLQPRVGLGLGVWGWGAEWRGVREARRVCGCGGAGLGEALGPARSL